MPEATILRADVDAFFASVEQRDDPEQMAPLVEGISMEEASP